MLRKWFAVAVLALGVGQSRAPGQYIPSPVGPATMPEPLPLKPSLGPDGKPVKGPPPPNFVQGPISPEAAPPGPADELGLPAGHSNAFPAENFAERPHLFVHAGALYLWRQQLGDQSYVYVDTMPVAPGQEFNQLPTNIGHVASVLSPGDIRTQPNFGILGTIGCMWKGCAVEVNGFYIPDASDSTNIFAPRILNSYFRAPAELAAVTGTLVDPNDPLLTIPNDVFLQGDVAAMTLKTSLGGAEVNARYFPRNMTSCEPLIGVRYLNFTERFTFRFDDDGLTSANPLGVPNQSTAAIVSSRMNNNFVGPQVGLENQLNICQGLVLGLTYKGALGVDYADHDYTLSNASGTSSRISQRYRRNLASVQEVDLFFDAYYLERLRMRIGYRALWLVNFPEAVDQIDFNLSNPNGRVDNTGNIFFHGATLELQILF